MKEHVLTETENSTSVVITYFLGFNQLLKLSVSFLKCKIETMEVVIDGSKSSFIFVYITF